MSAGVCSESGCPKRAVRSGRCLDHAQSRDRQRQRSHWRVTGSSAAQRLATWRRFDGICQGCGAGCSRPGDNEPGKPKPIREHLVAVADGGSDDDENITLLCEACAARKTAIARRQGLSG